MQKVTAKGFKKKEVAFVAECYFNQIRNMKGATKEQRQTNIGLIEASLVQTAQMYGARETVPRFVITECVRLVFEKYSFLALDEIREAYRQKAAGEIKIKGAEMYGGVFNADNLGKVLSSYNAQRKKIMAAFLTEKYEVETAYVRKLYKCFRAILAEVALNHALVTGNGGKIETWQQVPEWYYEAAKKRDLFEYEVGEKKSYYTRALELTPQEIKREKEEQQEQIQNFRILKKIEEVTPERMTARIARKLVVFEKVIR